MIENLNERDYEYLKLSYGASELKRGDNKGNNLTTIVSTNKIPLDLLQCYELYFSANTLGLSTLDFVWKVVLFENPNTTSETGYTFYSDRWIEDYEVVDASSVVQTGKYKYFCILIKDVKGVEINPGLITSTEIEFYGKYRWLVDIYGPKNRLAPKIPADPMNPPYPKALWRINPAYNDGFPYHELLPNISHKQIEFETYTSPCVYKIYANDTLIFSSDLPEKEYALISPILDLEDSHAGSLKFTMPVTHFYLDKIDRFTTRFFVTKNDILVWDGRILDMEFDFYNNCNVTAEGALAYLNDTIQPLNPYNARTFKQIVDAIIDIHNNKVDESRRFKVEFVPLIFPGVDPQKSEWSTEYTTTMEAINAVAEALEAHIVLKYDKDGTRLLYIYQEENMTEASKQSIVFGSNLMDFTRSYDMSNLTTVLLPLGKKSSGGKSYVGEEVKPDEYSAGQIMTTYKDESGIVHVDHVVGYPDNMRVYGYTKNIIGNAKSVYITTRLPKLDNALLYVVWVKRNNENYVYDYKSAGDSGYGYEVLSQVKIDIPTDEEFYKIEVGGEVVNVDIVVNASTETGEDDISYITVESVNNGDKYVRAKPRTVEYIDHTGKPSEVYIDPVNDLGWVERVVQFDDIESPSDLLKKANDYLDRLQFDSMSIEVSAVDLINLGVETNSLELYQKVRVISPPHGLDKVFPLDKLEIHLNDPTANIYGLNSKDEYSIAQANEGIDTKLLSIIENMPITGAVLDAARANADSLIKAGFNGVVTLVRDEATNTITAITISADGDWERPDAPHWVWNEGGLAYYKYVDGKLQISEALTKDGSIVCDRLTSGTVFANWLLGGELRLGNWGKGADNGSIVVKGEAGGRMREIFKTSKDGSYIYGTIFTENDKLKTWMKIERADITFGNYDETGTAKTHSYFDGAAYYHDSDEDKDYMGFHMEADIFDFDTKKIWVRETRGQSATAYECADREIEVVTDVRYNSDGEVTGVSKETLKFVHGLLVY